MLQFSQKENSDPSQILGCSGGRGRSEIANVDSALQGGDLSMLHLGRNGGRAPPTRRPGALRYYRPEDAGMSPVASGA